MDSAASRLADAAVAAADAAGPQQQQQRSQRSSSSSSSSAGGRSGRSSASGSSSSNSSVTTGGGSSHPPRAPLPSAAAQFRAAQAATSTPSVRPPPPPLPKAQRFADLRWVSPRAHSSTTQGHGPGTPHVSSVQSAVHGTRRRSRCRGCCCSPVIVTLTRTVTVGDSRGRSDESRTVSSSRR